MGVIHSEWKNEELHLGNETLSLGTNMVKILEIGGQPTDAEEDDDCCEINPAEFAKKVNLKSDDDEVVIVAAKGQIKVKVEIDQSGHAAETFVGNLHECAAGYSLENPYEIEDDEPSVRQIESVEAKPDAVCILDNSKIDALVKSATDKSKIDVLADAKSIPEEIAIDAAADVKCIPDENKTNVLAHVKCIPDENKIDPLGDVKCTTDKSKIDVLADAKSIPDEIKTDAADVKCIPDENKVDVLADVKCLSDKNPVKFGNFEVFIQDMLPVKCEHEDSNGIDEGVEEEDAYYDHIPEMDGVNLEEYLGPGGGVFDEEDSDDFVVVGRESL
ncbi:uncharacterized protein LOC104584192 [Brachypodium distachyon]|uniref:Uncharacterized protein n=1 Tax=Brachypodium distachyon TaxID=15368 RepID=A0A0Q3M0A8_BRADI|nr:uncharacterized protein LOC104584192 [Brachypodium distachyon]KQJ97909.1 hypothetical protein BRADI_3g34060v3 [Brachypodium distachyon]|eukprot:XP_014756229.1 uncharacterized protein LOC104584192 [Brachypodium distachyon]